MSSIDERLSRLESAVGDGDDAKFHRLVVGEYNPALSLRQNLAAAVPPSGAVPTMPVAADVN